MQTLQNTIAKWRRAIRISRLRRRRKQSFAFDLLHISDFTSIEEGRTFLRERRPLGLVCVFLQSLRLAQRLSRRRQLALALHPRSAWSISGRSAKLQAANAGSIPCSRQNNCQHGSSISGPIDGVPGMEVSLCLVLGLSWTSTEGWLPASSQSVTAAELRVNGFRSRTCLRFANRDRSRTESQRVSISCFKFKNLDRGRTESQKRQRVSLELFSARDRRAQSARRRLPA